MKENTLLLLVVGVGLSAWRVPSVQPKATPVTQPSSTPQSSPEGKRSVNQLIKELAFSEKEKTAGMSQAWAHVPNNNHYRVARKSDFEDSFLIHNYGEMAGAYGLACLIVDNTITGEERFSLVIFIERPAGRYDVYWIYRNMDLFKYRMTRSSGDILVEEVRPDGVTGVCEIQWDGKERRWTCTGR